MLIDFCRGFGIGGLYLIFCMVGGQLLLYGVNSAYWCTRWVALLVMIFCSIKLLLILLGIVDQVTFSNMVWTGLWGGVAAYVWRSLRTKRAQAYFLANMNNNMESRRTRRRRRH